MIFKASMIQLLGGQLFVGTILMATTAMGALPDDFRTCVTTVGAEYVAARDKILTSDGLDGLLKERLQNGDWNEKATAMILKGWRENAQRYKDLTAVSPVMSIKGQPRFLWASDPNKIDASLAPLAFEFILKESGGDAGLQAAIQIIPYLARHNPNENLSFIVQALSDARTRATVRVAAARLLERLPETAIGHDTILALLEGEARRSDVSGEVARTLLNGVVSRAPRMSAEQKDQTVAKLLENKSVEKTVGKKPIVLSIGGIGGRRALPVVEDALRNAQDDGDRRWALSTVASIGTPEALESLKRYLSEKSLSQDFQAEAVRGLGRAPFSEAVRNYLTDILYKEKSPRIRSEALRSLETLMNQTVSPESKESIRRAIKGLDEKSLTDPTFRRDFKAALDRIAK